MGWSWPCSSFLSWRTLRCLRAWWNNKWARWYSLRVWRVSFLHRYLFNNIRLLNLVRLDDLFIQLSWVDVNFLILKLEFVLFWWTFIQSVIIVGERVVHALVINRVLPFFQRVLVFVILLLTILEPLKISLEFSPFLLKLLVI